MLQEFFSVVKRKLDELLVTDIDLFTVLACSHFQVSVDLFKDSEIQVVDVLVDQVNDEVFLFGVVISPLQDDHMNVVGVDNRAPAFKNLH